MTSLATGELRGRLREARISQQQCSCQQLACSCSFSAPAQVVWRAGRAGGRDPAGGLAVKRRRRGGGGCAAHARRPLLLHVHRQALPRCRTLLLGLRVSLALPVNWVLLTRTPAHPQPPLPASGACTSPAAAPPCRARPSLSRWPTRPAASRRRPPTSRRRKQRPARPKQPRATVRLALLRRCRRRPRRRCLPPWRTARACGRRWRRPRLRRPTAAWRGGTATARGTARGRAASKSTSRQEALAGGCGRLCACACLEVRTAAVSSCV